MPDNTDPVVDVEEEVVEEEVVEDNDDEDVVTEEAPEVEEEPVKEEPFDVEEFKKSTVEETQKVVLGKIAESLGLTKEEKVEAKDELVPPWEQRGEEKPRSWKEHAEYSADLAQWKRQKDEEQIAKVQEENEKEAVESNKKWNDYWDSELDDLVKTGKIPAIKDPEDNKDEGKQARVKLFAKMQEIGIKRRSEGKPPITSVKLVYYEHYNDGEPAGAAAPVSFGKKGVSTGKSDDDYTYAEIHSKSIDQLKGG